MRRAVLALPLLMLAACATPRERCIADASHDLTVVDHLIAQLERDIARGYGTRQTQVIVPMWRPCFPPRVVHGRHRGRDHPHYAGPNMCWQDTVQTTTTPVAIDLAQAKKTLAELKKKQVELNRQAGPAIAQCQALYPK
jgi:hypothetical protein